MSVSNRHLLRQTPVALAMLRTGVRAFLSRGAASSAGSPALPGPTYSRFVPPLPPELVSDYLRFLGAEPVSRRGHLPAHLFPQWTMPVAARSLDGLPFPLARAVNGGCTLRRIAAIPAGEPLRVHARLIRIDEDERKVLLTTSTVTERLSGEALLEADLRVVIPRGGARRGGAERPRVPNDAREIARRRFSESAGLDFAKLTGDLNPIHWVRPYAQAMGFSSVILHGFATLAWAYEGLRQNVFSGSDEGLRTLDVRFTRPLVLPAQVGLFVRGTEVFVGDAPGGPAYLCGERSNGVEA